jgi:hypothetical protein
VSKCTIADCYEPAAGLMEWPDIHTVVELCQAHADYVGAIERVISKPMAESYAGQLQAAILADLDEGKPLRTGWPYYGPVGDPNSRDPFEFAQARMPEGWHVEGQVLPAWRGWRAFATPVDRRLPFVTADGYTPGLALANLIRKVPRNP